MATRKHKQTISCLKKYSILCLLMAGCSTPLPHPVSESFTKRDLTLPKDVSSWRMYSSYGTSLTVFPFIWEQGLTDSITLIWFPIPLEAKILLFKKEDLSFALDVNALGITYVRADYFDWAPYVKILSRKNISPNFIIDSELFAIVELRRTDPMFNTTLGMSVSPGYQILPKLELGISIQAWLEWNNPRNQYLGTLPSVLKSPNIRFPLGEHLHWMISPQVELELTHTFLGLGYPGDYSFHQGSASFRYFW